MMEWNAIPMMLSRISARHAHLERVYLTTGDLSLPHANLSPSGVSRSPNWALIDDHLVRVAAGHLHLQVVFQVVRVESPCLDQEELAFMQIVQDIRGALPRFFAGTTRIGIVYGYEVEEDHESIPGGAISGRRRERWFNPDEERHVLH